MYRALKQINGKALFHSSNIWVQNKQLRTIMSSLRQTICFIVVRVARSLAFCVMFCRSLFALFSLFQLAILLSVLRFTASDYTYWYLRFTASDYTYWYLQTVHNIQLHTNATMTVKCSTATQPLFLYINLCLSVKLDSLSHIHILST